MYFRCTICWLDICKHCELMTKVKVMATSITSHSSCDGNRYTLWKFPVYNIVVLAIVIVLYIRPLHNQDLFIFRLKACDLWPAALIFHISQLLVTIILLFGSIIPTFFRFYIQVRWYSICLSLPGLFHLMSPNFIHTVTDVRISFFFMAE